MKVRIHGLISQEAADVAKKLKEPGRLFSQLIDFCLKDKDILRRFYNSLSEK